MVDLPRDLRNLGPRGRRQRLVLGLVAAAAAVAGLAWVLVADPPRASRLLVAIPFFVAGLGLFQAQAST